MGQYLINLQNVQIYNQSILAFPLNHNKHTLISSKTQPAEHSHRIYLSEYPNGKDPTLSMSAIAFQYCKCS